MKTTKRDEEEAEKSLSSEQHLINGQNIILTTDNRPIAMYIAGCIAKNILSKVGSCCNTLLVGDLGKGNEDLNYQKLLWRDGSAISSTDLISYVCNSFC